MRLIPRTLAGRLSVLLLGALVVSTAVGALGFVSERHRTLLGVGVDQVAVRTAALVRLIDRAPPDLHDDILAASATHDLRARITEAPAVAVPADPTDIERLLTDRLSAELGVDVRVRGGWRLRWDDDDRDDEWDDDRHDDWDDDWDDDRDWRSGDDADRPWRDRRWRGHRVAVSAPLTDGRWLAVETGFADRPFRWWGPVQVSTLLMAVAIVLILWFVVRRALRPVTRMAEAADALGRGERTPPLDETGPDDIRRTVRAFNAMSARIDRFVRDRTELLAAISHDLRTPITALRLRIEFIEDAETRTRMAATLDELQAMVEALLTFARAEAEQEPTQTVDLVSLVRAAAGEVDEAEGRAAPDATPVSGPDTLALRCRPMALKRCIRNLVQNALRYGASARIAVAADGGRVLIRIDDDGPGIPEDRLDDMLQPFVRLDESRSRDTGGVGLGLSIARGVARAHGGDVRLANRPEGGLRAEIDLPA
jgi:signal transduction histidine kinase